MTAYYPHRARKRFGQHFLKNVSTLQNIVDAIQLQKNDCVVEIGPGKGALTNYLLSQVSHIDAIELDRDLADFLHTQFAF